MLVSIELSHFIFFIVRYNPKYDWSQTLMWTFLCLQKCLLFLEEQVKVHQLMSCVFLPKHV